ncbi:hypothetical protein CO083_05050 [Candidatus Roizmanbacteria bacterium CG_4_9_14_0_8_um_filter_34_12]|uniref:Nudix hydrolase domain-containing protein n=1 Tax=Candidatus Roizmanbacteria bacterium CG_4_9_14_0_8_um_filter_34_12 TaxID=1974840 RepID=A0A2M8DBM3_9BACT|nr:MAG: hypothetical protein CO083_05050 [Candidatus Roizmanbacteria bacterium CG_4_9_14_0_8_um_filter_34_12]
MKKNIISVVIIVIRHKNNYLLTHRVNEDDEDHHFQDHWQIPGGGQEYMERLEDTARREAKEELGLDIKIQKFIPKVFDAIRSDWHGVLHCFLCKIIDKNQKITLNEEADRFAWFTVEEIKNLPAFPDTYGIILEAEKLK